MAQTIKLKRSATSGAVPTTGSLELGEVAINTYDGKMYIKKNDGTESVVEIGEQYVLPFTDNSTNWNTAYSWGDHASAGYLPSSSYTNVFKSGSEIAGSQDLNNYRTTGYYSQDSNADATSGSNYPVSLAGLLEVITGDQGNGLQTEQRYSRYNTNDKYVRHYYNGNWTAWAQQWTSASDGSGSGLDADLLDGQQGSYYAPKSAPDFTGEVFTDASQNAWAFRATTGATSNSSGLWFTGTTARLLLRDSSGVIKTSISANGTNSENIINGNTIWHAGNDGSGSGLDADLLDGQQGSAYLRSNVSATNSVDLRAPIFYDSGNTGNYLDSPSSSIFRLNGSTAVNLAVGGTTKLTATTTGIGIGTSSPMARLDVESGAGNVGFNYGTSSSPERGNLWYDTDGTGWKFNIGKVQSGSFTSQVTIQDNGNVGIGTSSPSEKLTVAGSIQIEDTDGYLQFKDTNGATNNKFRRIYNSEQSLYISRRNDDESLEANDLVIDSAGAVTAYNSLRAPIFYDSDNTSYYVNPAGNSRMDNVLADKVYLSASASNKLGFWGGTANYSIGMSPATDATNGGRVAGETTSDYNMYFTMSGGTNRGFVFRSSDSSGSAVAGIDAGGNARFNGSVTATGVDHVFGNSSNTNANVYIRATNTAGAPAHTATLNFEGYEGRGQGTFHTDVSYAGQEWFSGIPYSAGFSAFQIGFDAAGGQAEYGANSIARFTNAGDFQMGTTTVIDSSRNLKNVNSLQFSDTSPTLQEDGNYLRIQTASGWTSMGSGNSSWTHFFTDRGGFYFGTRINVNGEIKVYNSNTRLISTGAYAPAFYDSDDTAFYVNPASTSVMNTVYIGGSGGGYISRNPGSQLGSMWIAAGSNGTGGGNTVVLAGGNVPYVMADQGGTSITGDLTPSGTLYLDNPNNSSTNDPNIDSKGELTSGTAYSYHALFKDGNGVIKGRITHNQYGAQFSNLSDYRAKEDYQEVENATSRLMSIPVRNFQWIGSDLRTDGFLAHEIAEVVPEAVVGEKDAVLEDGTPDYQSIDQSKIVPLLVKTIQELEARITALENA